VRIAKVHSHPRFFAQLLCIAISQPHGPSNAEPFVGESLQHIGRTGGRWVWQLDEHH
jgi:hypothetical protein